MMTTGRLMQAKTRRFERRRRAEPCAFPAVRPRTGPGEAAVESYPRGVPRRLGSTVGGRYRLDALLGCGASGAVFAAFDHETGEQVAVKVLHERHRGDREQVDRFLAEARFVGSIGHPGVVQVFDAGIDAAGHVTMVMEMLRGESLADVVERGAVLPDDAVEIGCQLLDVLAAAHARGIVHRDVKPDNVFLTRAAGGALSVKLLDFGIAKCADGAFVGGGTTLEGLALGTPHYMSPEQCRGDTVGPQTDVWAVGAVLYHALTGRPPHDADSPMVLLERIVTTPVPPLASLRPEVPPRVAAAVDRALERRLDRRFRSAAAMSHALRT